MEKTKPLLKNFKKTIFVIACLIVSAFVLFRAGTLVLAEQGGSSPESGATSRLKTLSDALIASSYGSTAAGAWGDWGAMWNRIYSSATWTATLGDAVIGDVLVGKKFYAGANRTLQTGTAAAPIDYSLQWLETKDDYLGTYKAEESTWTEVSGSPFAVGATGLATGKVKLDARTGLKWSASSTSTTITNSFNAATDGVRPTGGNAIAFCDGLNSATFGGKTNWYLPTQKELMQAYIDGIYSQDTVFGTTNTFWSSSEQSNNSTTAWYVYLYNGTPSTTVRLLAPLLGVFLGADLS
jgi:hypothetical protein